MAGYTRQSAADIVAGEDVTAAPLAAEFNAIQSAFNSSTGHTHDGTTGNGPKINLTTSVTARLPYANLVEIANMKVVGNVSGSTGSASEVTIYDEDNMASNSATALATQQSIKAYVDSSSAAGQPLDALLTAIAALSTSADQLIYTTGTDTVAMTSLTAQARALLDDASYSAMRTTLGLAIGTDVQAYDADLGRLASIGLGTAGYVLQTDGSSSFSWVRPTAESIAKDFVASGSIANGDAVALKADGTVEVISGTYTEDTYGSEYTITASANGSTTGYTPEVRYDAVNAKVYVAWHSGASVTSIQVGTVSGNTITFGTAATITWGSAHSGKPIALGIDTTNQKFVLLQQANWSATNRCYATAGSVSGTTITLGSPTTVGSDDDVAFVKWNSTASVWMCGVGASTSLLISAATISGTTLTFGSQVTVAWDATSMTTYPYFHQRGGAEDGVASATRLFISASNILYEDGGKLFMSYHNGGGQVRVATFSGTTITLGSAAATSGSTNDAAHPPYIEKLETDKFITTRVNNSSLDFEVAICTVSGSTVTVGSWFTVLSARGSTADWIRPQAIRYDSTLGKILVFYEILSSGDTTVNNFCSMLTYTGTTPTVQLNVPFSNLTPRFYRENIFIRTGTSEVVVLATFDGFYGSLGYYVGTISGSTLSFSSPTIIKSDAHYGGIGTGSFSTTSLRSYCIPVSNEKYMLLFSKLAASTATYLFVGTLYNETTNADYYIGVAQDTVTNGQNVTVLLNGTIVPGLSGLTIRANYYLNADGTIQTTSNGRPFGTAISTTEILMA